MSTNRASKRPKNISTKTKVVYLTDKMNIKYYEEESRRIRTNSHVLMFQKKPTVDKGKATATWCWKSAESQIATCQSARTYELIVS